MYLARVAGTVWASQKTPSLEGLRFQILRQVGPDLQETGASLIAADAVGAGMGDLVLYATGSSARQTPVTENRPVDAVIMAVVDSFDIEGKVVFQKSGKGDR
jgi:microcompartment protein CcmK/EutM